MRRLSCTTNPASGCTIPTFIHKEIFMKNMKWLFVSLLLLAGSALAFGQDAKPAEHHTVAQVLDHGLTGVEGEFVPAAGAMPEDKYSFAPTTGEFKGVRTF